MLITGWPRRLGSDLKCQVCRNTVSGMGSSVGVCPECITGRWEESRHHLTAVHAESREPFRLPVRPPANPEGLECNLCMHRCRMGPNESGYCGIRLGAEESFRLDGQWRARVSSYFDPLPTNCVADWVCAGGTGAGYPVYAYERGPEVGFHNLAVFFEACNFNCLYCQNWTFKKSLICSSPWQPIEALTQRVDEKTSCICYFGGDPTPQIGYAIRVSERARLEHPDQILRICWETNGSVQPVWLRQMVALSLESGGCIKIDLKAWDPHIHQALCGCDNRQVLANFAEVARHISKRPEPPLLIASTLLVPGYVDAKEIFHLASFIAGCDPQIPYTLLAFAPQFRMEDFPTTSRKQAEECLQAARDAGLDRVHLGNPHLLGTCS